MNNQHMLLRAILEDPFDDTVRLVYADEIEDIDPDRAEFIRLQIQLARTPWDNTSGECFQCWCHRNGRQGTNGKCHCTEGFRSVRRRESELIRSYGCAWAEPDLPDVVRTLAYRGDERRFYVWKRIKPRIDCAFPVVFKRGFVCEIACETKDWMAHGAKMVLKQPIIHIICEGPSPSTTARRTGGGPNSRCYVWWRSDLKRSIAATIPNELWPDPTKRRFNFATEALARQTLSDWCVDAGRREAGLKPLTRAASASPPGNRPSAG